MTSTIKVIRVDKRRCKLEVTSDCAIATSLGLSLGEFDVSDAFKPMIDSWIYNCASECHLHTSCPIPMAILKTIEIELKFALPQAISVYFEEW